MMHTIGGLLAAVVIIANAHFGTARIVRMRIGAVFHFDV